jgi:hypothetical protein
MAYTPLSPSGVANALQNVAKFPDSRLQQYAAGRPPQPTGQVQPGPTGQAAQELNARGMQRQAAQRQQAMQNNPANSPTIFQQKDMELQQKAQQIQQQEQKLGLLGALMAKKAQDMQARDTTGIGSLPLDTFNAMDGGIVFSGGGGVKGYSGEDDESVVRRIDASKLPRFDPLAPSRELSDEQKYALLRWGQMLGDAKTKEAALRAEQLNKQPPPPSREEKKEDTGRRGSGKTNTPSGVAGLDIEGRMRRGLASVRGESDKQEKLVGDIQRNLEEQYEAIDKSNLSDAQKEAARKKVTDAMQAEYAEYTTGRESRQKAVADALRGKKPGMFEGIASALPSGRASFADVLAGAARGVTTERGRYRDADKEAALYMARAQEESAKADMLEKRGQRAEAQAAEDRAQKLMNEAATRRMQALGVKKEGIAALLQREDAQQAIERAIAEKAVTAQLDYETKERLERLKASLQPREVSFYNQVLAAFNSGDPKRIQAAKDTLSAMSLSKPTTKTGEITPAQLRRSYDSEMRTWDTNLKGPRPTFEQWKARSDGSGEDVVDFTGGKG